MVRDIGAAAQDRWRVPFSDLNHSQGRVPLCLQAHFLRDGVVVGDKQNLVGHLLLKARFKIVRGVMKRGIVKDNVMPCSLKAGSDHNGAQWRVGFPLMARMRVQRHVIVMRYKNPTHLLPTLDEKKKDQRWVNDAI